MSPFLVYLSVREYSMRIYLAGAISGCSYEEAVTWRHDVAHKLVGYNCLNPMGDKDELAKEQAIRVTPLNGLHTADQAIVSRDKFSVKTSDLVLANLSYGENPLVGTSVEIGWADAFDIPIIAVFKKGTRFDHPFTRVLCYRVDTLDEAVQVIKTYK